MSNRQWLNPLISMGATIIMCVLLAASHSKKSSPKCITDIEQTPTELTKKNDGPFKEILIKPVI